MRKRAAAAHWLSNLPFGSSCLQVHPLIGSAPGDLRLGANFSVSTNSPSRGGAGMASLRSITRGHARASQASCSSIACSITPTSRAEG